MSNMSYCRFENTNNDLGECLAAMEDVRVDLDDLDLNKYEAAAFHELASRCAAYLSEYERLTGITLEDL
jgi:hypothetical protein